MVVEPLVKADGSVLAVIEDAVLRDADVTSSNVVSAIAAMMGFDRIVRVEAVEIGLPGNSTPGFLLMVSARPSKPSPEFLRVFAGVPPAAGAPADMRELLAEIPLPTRDEAMRSVGAGVDETKFPRLAELISIARWHIRFGDWDHRTKVVEEAENELRFARRESDMLAEELAKPRVETRAELIAKLSQKAVRKLEQASRIVRCVP